MKKPRPNADLREMMRRANVFQYSVAAELGMSTCNFQKILQRDIPEDQRQRIVQAIDSLR